MPEYFRNLECLACGNHELQVHCDLGEQPLVNDLKNTAGGYEHKFPLVVNFCPICTHKQLSISVNPRLLFSNYLYKTGTSKSHFYFFEGFVNSIWTKNTVLDIGCNDGTLLSIFKGFGWKVLGIEPCENLADEVDRKGIEVINDFFPTKESLGKFDCITAFNVFAHNDNPKNFLTEMAKLLQENGRIYILTTPARIDNFYHEHVSYFTPRSMIVLADRCGLEVKSFRQVSMHGVSHLFELAKPREIPAINIKLPEEGVVGYGASASGIVLMNIMGWVPEYVVDDNPLKQGKYIPGVNVPIYSSDAFIHEKRNLTFVILAYHLFEEIVAKIRILRPDKKDVFIHPMKGNS